MRLALTLFLILFSFQAANAEYLPWMEMAYKQEDPNELAYFLVVGSDCPVRREEVTALLEGVFVRSRIKPLGDGEWLSYPLYLSVSLDCVEYRDNKYAYTAAATFGNYSGEVPILFDLQNRAFGIGDKNFMQTVLQTKIENALTDYLKANFNLGD